MLRLATALLLAAGLTAQSPLQSTFVGGLQISNPGPAAATQLFDITVTDPAGLTIHRIDTNINTTCLLYTSPSPRDLSTSRMPSSA